MSWTLEDRRELARIFAEDDVFRAQRLEDERQRQEQLEAAAAEKAATEQLAQRTQAADAERTYTASEDAPAVAPELLADPDFMDDLARELGTIIATIREEWREAIEAERKNYERAITERDVRISELKGALDMLMAIAGPRSATRNAETSLVDLPSWRQN